MSRASAAVFVGAFAALAGLVATGALTGVDRWAMTHAMPEARFGTAKPTLAEGLIPLYHVSWRSAVAVTTDVVTLPAAFLVASAIVVAACAVLRNRAAVLLGAAYVVGNVVEEIVKALLTRPPLYAHGVHVAAYDNSFPSGHALRSVLVAAAVATAWPRLRVWAAVWALGSVAMVEIGALHVPSDIVGGSLLAGTLLATTSSSRRVGWSRSRRPSPACRPSARVR